MRAAIRPRAADTMLAGTMAATATRTSGTTGAASVASPERGGPGSPAWSDRADGGKLSPRTCKRAARLGDDDGA